MLYDIIFCLKEYVYIFVPSALICLFFGVVLVLSCKVPKERKIFSRHDVFLLVTSIWLIVSVFSALPFYIYKGEDIKFITALFEATSGLTTTGFTIYTDVEILPEALQVWRLLLHFMGGVGIVAIAIVALPIMKIGGMQLFLTENSDKSKKFLPRSSQIATLFVGVYIAIICFFAIWLHLAGMETFDAIYHSVSAISLSGISLKNNGIAFYGGNYIKFIMSIGMLIGGLTFIEIIKFFRNGFRGFFNNHQVRLYLILISSLTSFTLLFLFFKDRENLDISCVTNCFFDIVAALTTAGFSTQLDVKIFPWLSIILILVSILGGCSGSTSGGIKIFRLQILCSIIKSHIKKVSNPFNISIPKYQNENISNSVVTSVVAYCMLFVASGIFSIILLNLAGVEQDSILIVLSALCNTGKTFNAQCLNCFTEFILILDMLIGRLEVVPILILMTKTFWKNRPICMQS